MKTILNISLLLMVVAASAGTANFVSMYRSGDIDKIYDHGTKPEIVQASVEPETIVEPVVEEEVITEPEASSGVTKVEPKIVEEDMIEEEEILATTTDGAKVSREQLAAAPQTIVTDTVNHTKYAEKKVGKKKFRLSMYSRAPLWEEVEEVASADSTAPGK